MKKWLKKHLKNEKGLTLVELLAVIVILGIIAAIAVPSIGNVIENSRIKAVKADALNALSAANLYFVENDTAANVTVKVLSEQGYFKDTGSLAVDSTTITKENASKENKPTINGTGTFGKEGKKEIKFNDATVEEINNSGNSLTVPAGNNP